MKLIVIKNDNEIVLSDELTRYRMNNFKFFVTGTAIKNYGNIADFIYVNCLLAYNLLKEIVANISNNQLKIFINTSELGLNTNSIKQILNLRVPEIYDVTNIKFENENDIYKLFKTVPKLKYIAKEDINLFLVDPYEFKIVPKFIEVSKTENIEKDKEKHLIIDNIEESIEKDVENTGSNENNEDNEVNEAKEIIEEDVENTGSTGSNENNEDNEVNEAKEIIEKKELHEQKVKKIKEIIDNAKEKLEKPKEKEEEEKPKKKTRRKYTRRKKSVTKAMK